MMTEEAVTKILSEVKYPGFNRDIVSFGLVRGLEVKEGVVRLALHITTADTRIPAMLEQEIREKLMGQEGVSAVEVGTKVTEPVAAAMQAGGIQANKIDGVRHIVAVASGKGGVGKSTVAANLAVAFLKKGLRVGLCDCDIYGPSMGLMFSVEGEPRATEDERILPVVSKEGVKLMSMGFLMGDDAPAVLRGPLVTRYTQQFLRTVDWGELDVLVLDLPPGTGDIQLTIVQTVALDGAVIVTTPQEVALIDARKASAMFGKVNVPVLGIIENMSYYEHPGDPEKVYLFGREGGRREAERQRVGLLTEVPINVAAREAADEGDPIVARDEANPASQAFLKAAERIQSLLEEAC